MNRQLEETQLHDLVRDTIARWRDGEEPNAAALLTRHPDLSRNKRLAVDLIYEEFCLRSEAGDTVVRSTFCDRFPGYQASLVKMLEVHDELEHSSDAARTQQPLVWPQVGESFLGYQLVESLGRGALARVFLAREAALGGRLVVVKVSQHGASEAQMLGKIAHPAIVPVFSVRHDETTGWTVICMPLVGTATATDLIDAAYANSRPPVGADVIPGVARQFVPVGVPHDEPLSAEQRLWQGSYADGIARFGLHLAEGLSVAHDVGIMHRDIKPSNVLLGWSGLPMLLDFNLSTDIGLVSKRVGGTLPYMAPELMRGVGSDSRAEDQRQVARQFDPRSDVFSLGAVLYQLLTGQLPARPANADRLPVDAAEPWLACRQQPVKPLRALNPAIDPELQAIVLRCLAFAPDQRYATAKMLGDALGRYLSPLARAKRLVRRHRRAILLTVAGTVAVVAGGTAYTASLPPYEERLFARGLQEFDRGQYAAAAATFDECRKLRPTWDEACFAHGQSLRQAGDFVNARNAYLAMSKEHAVVAQAMAGYCLLECDDAHGAYSNLSLAVVHLGALDPITLTNYAHCLRARKEFNSALLPLNDAIQSHPDFALAYYQRAMCTLQPRGSLPSLPETAHDARRACELEPTAPHFHFLAALALARGTTADQDGAAIKEHLQSAAKHGYPVKYLRRERSFAKWFTEPATADLPVQGDEIPPKHAIPPATPFLHDFRQAASL